VGSDADTDVQVLDPEAARALYSLLGDDREALAEVVDAFLDEAPVRLAELHDGVAQGDAALAGRAAHSLKSGGMTFGATGLAAICRRLEASARAGELGACDELIGTVDARWEQVRLELVALRDHGPR
jgi:HPt (histidine-containing phosphotransfer) domain-containing protein